MKDLYNIIAKLSADYLDEIIEIRRELHRYPELSFREDNTALMILNYLREMNINDITRVAGTGLLAKIKGGGKKKVVLRAELDALPVNEETGAAYSSLNNGLMHACGHDVHMAILIGSAKIFLELGDKLENDIYLLFQPGEELAPGGASKVMKEGILQKIKPDAVIGQHVLPEMESGKTGFRSGRYMASNDEIYITVEGKGGHAALPGASTDQVLAASIVVKELKEGVARMAGNDPYVFGIGKFIADGATNVIPEKVYIEGTVRTFKESLRSKIHSFIHDYCRQTAFEGIRAKAEIRKGYPVLTNNDMLTKKGIAIAGIVNGGKNKVEMLDLRMSSDDFAFYTSEFPSLYYRIGVKGKNKTVRNLHSSDFDIDERAMETGLRTLASIALGI